MKIRRTVIFSVLFTLKTKHIRRCEWTLCDEKGLKRIERKKTALWGERERGREKEKEKEPYYLRGCVHASHKPSCFILPRAKVRGGIQRSLISLGEKYRGRFYKNRGRSSFYWTFAKHFGWCMERRLEEESVEWEGTREYRRKGWKRGRSEWWEEE